MKSISIKDLVNSFPDMESLFKKADLAMGAALVILFAVGLSAYKTKDKLLEFSKRATHTNEILLELRQMISEVQDAESGISNYLLTQDTIFLDPYKVAVQQVAGHSHSLNNLVANYPELQQKVYKLNSLVNEKLTQLYQIIQDSTGTSGQKSNIQPRVVLGGMIMSDIRSLTAEIEAEQNNQLSAEVNEANIVAQKSYMSIAFAAALVFIFLLSARFFVSRQALRRLRAEDELKKTSVALENAVEGISRVSADGNFISINKTFSSVLGYSPDDLNGKNWLTIIDPDFQERALDAKETLIEKGKAEIEAPLICQNKTTRYFKITMISKQDAGSYSGHYCFITDIDSKKKENQELIAARKAALEASVAKSEFLANMSHEIRTPMNGVIGMTGLLAATKLSTLQKEYVDTIKVSADSLLGIINDILDLSKIESEKMNLETIDFDLKDVANDAKRILEHTAKTKGIALSVDVAPGVTTVLLGDPGKIRQVLVNLIGNAVKFTSEGKVSVYITSTSEDERNIELRVEVQDTGIGIPPEKQSRLFQAFSQADSSTTRRFGGTGLGLAICKRLVHMMKGEIGVTSEAGKGATFWFSMRLERGNSENVKRVDHTAYKFNAFNRPDIRILIVEDNTVNQRVALEMVSKLGLSAETADTGKVAVEMVKKSSYHLILMDCHLPEMDGYEATREIRKIEAENEGCRTPIVALTADVTSGDREMAFSAGMDDYATKPIEFDVLAKTLEKWLFNGAKPVALALTEASENVSTEVALAKENVDAVVATKPTTDSQKITAVAEDVPTINWAALHKLKGYQKPGGSNLLEDMLILYYASTPKTIETIQGAVEREELETVSEESHGLKSASAQLGFMRVADICYKLEKLEIEKLKNGEAEALAKSLRDEYLSAKLELSKNLKNKLSQAA